jgi:hypothetical protein
MEDRLFCHPDPDGTVVITRSPTGEGAHPPQVIARVYDPTYARVMANSPVLLGTLQWIRTLLDQNACHCQSGVRECVVCLTDDLLAAMDHGTVPSARGAP